MKYILEKSNKVKKEEKVFAEIGFGNDTFLSTEIESWENEKEIGEKRLKGFYLPKKIKEIYFRIWIGKRVLILSTSEVKIKKKDKNKIKFIFGIGGENVKSKK